MSYNFLIHYCYLSEKIFLSNTYSEFEQYQRDLKMKSEAMILFFLLDNTKLTLVSGDELMELEKSIYSMKQNC